MGGVTGLMVGWTRRVYNEHMPIQLAARLRQRGTRRSDRGASLIEFAIVAPVLCLLIFGIIDFGGVYSRQIGMRSGLRASTREAVIARFGSDSTCPTKELSSASLSVKLLVCNVKEKVALDPATTRVRILLIDGNDDGDAKHELYDDLMVCVMSEIDSITGFFDPLFAGVAYKGRLDMMIEKGEGEIPNLVVLESSGEAPLAGENWDFCDPTVPAP